MINLTLGIRELSMYIYEGMWKGVELVCVQFRSNGNHGTDLDEAGTIFPIKV